MERLAKFTFVFALLIFAFNSHSLAQVAIGTGATAPTINNKAVLLLTSSGSNQGLIIPIVSSLNGIGAGTTEKGMVVYNNTDNKVYFFDGTTWNSAGGSTANPQGIQINGNTISLNSTSGATFGLSTPAPTATGQLLSWNGNGWESTPAPTTTGQTLTWNQTTGKWTLAVPSGSTTTLIGDVSGPAGGNTISTSAGGSIVAALNNGSTTTKILESRLSPSATNNQVLTTIGGVAQWSSPAVTSLPSLSANQLFSNNGANTGITVGGDLGLSVTGTAGTFTIGSNAITSAKISNGAVTTAKIGTAGATDANKALTTDASGNPQWTALSAGGVTSVGLALPSIFTVSGSPITTSGTLTGTLASQAANTFLAGPAASVGTPSFRTLVAADIPALTAAQIPALDASKITTGTFTAAQIPSLDASKITTGTFTAAQIPSLDASKITTGSLPLTLGGTGGTSAATARTSLGLGSLATLSAVDLSGAVVTNTLPVARGGTGLSTFGGGLLYASGPTTIGDISNGTPGTVLTMVGSTPTWTSPAAISPANTLIRGNAGGTAQVASQIFDDGTTVSIAPNSPTGTALNITNGGGGVGVGGRQGLSAAVNTTGAENLFGLTVAAQGSGTGTYQGIFSLAQGSASFWNRAIVGGGYNGTTNIGVDGYADGNTGTNFALRANIGGTQSNSKYGLFINASGSGTKYGVFSQGEDVNYFSGNVGIGTTTPVNPLDVSGGVAIGASYAGVNTAPANGMAIQGNVGIGTGSPAFSNQLDVQASYAGGGNAINGQNNSTGNGVYGYAVNGGRGVWGYSPTGIGVQGQSGNNIGVFGFSSSGRAVYGQTGTGFAGYFDGTVQMNGDIYSGTSTSFTGIGGATSPIGASNFVVAGSTTGFVGMDVTSPSTTGLPYYAYNNGSTRVYTYLNGSTGQWILYNNGNRITVSSTGAVGIPGTLTKGSGTFKIDHPLDPTNKYLYHSFVESPDMMNVYNGNITTDESGNATVPLPEYFESLNKDFRYQLTVIGEFAQAIVAKKVAGNQFTIRTDKPNIEVSWQVTGIRKDPFAEKNRVKVEELKQGDEKGKFLHPEAYGMPKEMGIGWDAQTEIKKKNN